MGLFDAAKYEHIRADKTARFKLPEFAVPPSNPKPLTLILRHAGESNESWSAGLKNIKFQKLTEDEANAAVDALAAKTVIVGWEDALDENGSPVPYTPALGVQLLALLRDLKRTAMVNSITMFAGNASQFTAASIDAGDLGNG